MLLQFSRRNLYWLLATGLLLLILTYTTAGLIRDRRALAQGFVPPPDTLLNTPVHLNFDNVIFSEALAAVVREAKGTLAYEDRPFSQRPDIVGVVNLENLPHITVHSPAPVPLREAIYQLLARIDQSGIRTEVIVWEHAGIIHITFKDAYYASTDPFNQWNHQDYDPHLITIYDVSDLVAEFEGEERDARMMSLVQLINDGTQFTYKNDRDEPEVENAGVSHFNDKLIITGTIHHQRTAALMIKQLRAPR